MIQTNTKIGKTAEDIACKYLKNKGDNIIQRNFHTTYGEIDIISQNQKKIFFYEVKYRTWQSYGNGEDAISNSKIKKLRKSVEVWLTKEGFKYNFEDIYLNALVIDRFNNIVEFEID